MVKPTALPPLPTPYPGLPHMWQCILQSDFPLFLQSTSPLQTGAEKQKLERCFSMGFPDGAIVKNQPAVQETQVQSLGQEDPLEKEMATHSSLLA